MGSTRRQRRSGPMVVALVTDSSLTAEFRGLWRTGAAAAGVALHEIFVSDLSVQIADDGIRVLHGGQALFPDGAVYRTMSDSLPLLASVDAIWSSGGIPTVNSLDAVAVARDKVASARVLATAGIPVVPTVGIAPDGRLDDLGGLADMGGEIVVKPAHGSQGRDITVYPDLGAACAERRPATDSLWVAQPVWEPRGRDVRAFVVDGVCVAMMRRTAPPGTLVTNVAQGGAVEALAPRGAFAELAGAATAALGLTYAGVDMVESDPPRVLEVNGLAGFVALSTSTGVNPAEPIFQALARRQ